MSEPFDKTQDKPLDTTRDKQKFSKREAITFGWETVTNNFVFFASLIIGIGAISFALDFVSDQFQEDISALSSLIFFLHWIIMVILNMGLIYITLRFCDNAKPIYADLFVPSKKFLTFIAASILYGLIVFAGLILLIVPGIVWAIRYSLFRFLIIDEDLGPIDALKKSAELTDGSKWNLFLFDILIGLINILGALAFFVGLLVTIPLSLIASAYVYRTLLSASGSEASASTLLQDKQSNNTDMPTTDST